MLQEAGGEEHEARRLGARLGAEEDARLLATADGVRVGGDDLTEERVQPARRNAGLPAVQRRLDRRNQLLHVAAGEGGDVDPRGPRDLSELRLDLALQVVAALLVEGVPLVEGDDDRTPGLDGHGDDALVLDADRLAGVDEDHGDLGLLHGGRGTQRGVVVRTFLEVDPAPDTGRVDELPGDAAEGDQLVDRVTGGAGQLVDDHTVLVGHLVQQRGLADVRTADQRDTARAADRRAERLGRGLGKRLQHGVQHVAGTAAVQRRDRVGLAEAERPERGGVGLTALSVDLVGTEHDGLAGPAQQLDHGLVGVGGADRGVDHEDDRVGHLDRVLGLGGDGGVEPEDVLLPAARVDDLEATARPLGLVADPVTGDAGLVLDHGLTTADDAVHQRRLADVRTADDRERGKRAVTGLTDGTLDVLGVEPLLRGELHELRVLGIAKRSVLVVRAAGVNLVVHEVRSSLHHHRWTTQHAVHYSRLTRCAR